MRRIAFVGFVAVLTMVGGCGGGNSDHKPASASKATGSTVRMETSTTESNFSGAGSGEFCSLAKRYQDDFKSSSQADNPQALKKTFGDLREAVMKLVDAAPSEIKDDTRIVADYFVKSDAYLAKYNYDFTKIPPNDPNAPGAEPPTVKSANDRVEAYLRDVCKVDTGSTGGSSSTGAGGSGSSGASDANAADETTTTQP